VVPVSVVRLALDGYVLTPVGPILVPDLTPGTAVLVIAGGVATEAKVSEVSDVTQGETFRLLTVLGDIVLPGEEVVMTRKGPLPGALIASEVWHGRRPRLEVVNPTALPSTKRSALMSGRAVQLLLQSLHPPVVQLPAPVAEELGEELEAELKAAGVAFTTIADDRWMAFVFENVPMKPRKAGGRRVAESLLMLTAWGLEYDSLVSRTRLDAVECRRLVIAALVAEARPFEARWTPGYRPVECRLHQSHEGGWPPFVPVTGALRERASSVQLRTSRPGGLIVGLAVSGPVA
jgi:hypothetical protein